MKPRFVIIGAGSIFFTRAVAVGMCRDPHYRDATLVLVDTNPEMLETMTRVCERIVEASGAGLQIEPHTDRRQALPGADFVVLSFSLKGVDLRETETVIPHRYGIIQTSGDTIGPGGLFRAIRSIPAVVEVAQDVEKLCPEAWVMNYINPAPAVTAAIWKATGLRKVLSLCDGIVMPETLHRLLERVGLSPADLPQVDFKIGGINHFSWVTEFRHRGEDLMPRLLESLRREPEEYSNDAVVKLLEIFGYYSAIGGHMVEFLPYFQGRGTRPGHTNLLFEIHERRKWMRSFHEEISAQAAGTRGVEDLLQNTREDLTVRIANSILDNDGGRHHISYPNSGQFTNLPRDIIVEGMASIHRDRFEGEFFGDFPPVLRGWIMRVADVQELTVEAALQRSRKLLRQALAADPLTVSLEDTDAIIEELLEAEKDDLPAGWH